VAVEWLKAARDIRRDIKELLKIIVFGMTKSGQSGMSAEDRKSRRDRAPTKLKKLDMVKGRNLYCVSPVITPALLILHEEGVHG
jgi:hypothetical protein